LEPSLPSGDAPCPNCGHLLWWFQNRFADDTCRITGDTRFQEDLLADSTDFVELVMEFEDQFKVTIPDEEYEKIMTVADAIRLIERYRQQE